MIDGEYVGDRVSLTEGVIEIELDSLTEHDEDAVNDTDELTDPDTVCEDDKDKDPDKIQKTKDKD